VVTVGGYDVIPLSFKRRASAGDGGIATILLHYEGPWIVDSSGNNYPFSTLGSAGLSAGQAKFGTQSLFVPASGNEGIYIDSIGPVVGDSDFTVSCWVYRVAAPGQAFIMDSRTNGNNLTGFGLYFDAAGILYYYGGLGVNATSSAAVPLGVWTHIECSRDSAKTMRLFINGNKVAEAIGSDLGHKSSGSWTIGAAQYFPIGVAPLGGYIDEFRLCVGQCVHTASFTPLGVPYLDGPVRDPYWSKVVVLLNGSAIHNDAVGGVSVSQVNVTVVADPDFPGGAYNFPNGVASTITTDAGVDFGETDFTVELDYKTGTGLGSYPQMFSSASYGTTGSLQAYDSHASAPGTVSLAAYAVFPYMTGTPISGGARRVLAISRTAGVVRMFIDGIQVSTINSTFAFYGSQLRFGDGANSFTGRMARIRITQGIGRYTGNYITSNTPWVTHS
jgi:hypothetical protein